MTHPKLTGFFLPLLVLATSSCVFSIGGSRSHDTPKAGYVESSFEINQSGQANHTSGIGLPLLLAPWEGETSTGLEVTGVGYVAMEGGPDEAMARDAALADAMERARIMVGEDSNFMLIERRSFSATSDSDFGIKVLYGIQLY